MKKIINSASKQYVPVDTENLVLDDTPTEGSFNSVTSDGVAKAIAGGGGGGGTTYSAGDGISISEENEISAKVDGTTIGVNESGELEALGGGGSSLEAGDAINIQNDKINVRVDVDSIKIKSDTVVSSYNTYTYDYRNIDLWNMTSGTKCDWCFGADTTDFDITATAAQAGCQIRAALYDSESTRLSVSAHGISYWGMPKTLAEGDNHFSRGWYWDTGVRPSGYTFGTEFALPEGKTYGDVSMIALVAYDAANSQVVGDPLPFTHNSDIQFKMETDANSRLSVKNPLPDSSGASQGDVLSIGSEGPEWASAGGGGSSYTAGAGIAIDGNGVISVVPDNTTVKMERPLAAYATKDTFYGNMSFSDTLLGTATSSSTCTFSYGLNTNGAAFKIGCDSDQIGCQIRVEIGNDSSFTKSVISTVSMAKSTQSSVLVTLTDTDTILEGYGLSFYRNMMSPTYTFSNAFDWSEYTFDEIFGNSSVYVRLRAWDSTNGVVVGNVLRNPTSTGSTPYVSANMSINSDAVPQQVMVKFGNAANSGLTTNNSGLAVAIPVPSFDASTDAGKVLQVQNDGTLAWVTLS